MAEKLGVYICEGCDIGTSLNVDELVDYAKKGKLANICPVVKKSGGLCSPAGKAEIEADIAANGRTAWCSAPVSRAEMGLSTSARPCRWSA
jgi:quinone-modifying oxidoreductase subunit QmoB